MSLVVHDLRATPEIWVEVRDRVRGFRRGDTYLFSKP